MKVVESYVKIYFEEDHSSDSELFATERFESLPIDLV